jgi:hypothetical protein
MSPLNFFKKKKAVAPPQEAALYQTHPVAPPSPLWL